MDEPTDPAEYLAIHYFNDLETSLSYRVTVTSSRTYWPGRD